MDAVEEVIPVRNPAPAWQTLEQRDVDALDLDWLSKLNRREVLNILADFPGRSAWIPATREFVVCAPWRRRPEIGGIVDIHAPANPDAMLNAAVELGRRSGDTITMLIEGNERRPASFYQRSGMGLLESVIALETRIDQNPLRQPSIRIEVVSLPSGPLFERLLEVDHDAFPFIWRNSAEEFQIYLRTAGVEVFAAIVDDRIAGYIGQTLFAGWGHIDRLAVLPEMQGQGIGKELVRFGIARLALLGSRAVGLSTQEDNLISQHLYDQFGFHRTSEHDYRLYGTIHKPEGME